MKRLAQVFTVVALGGCGAAAVAMGCGGDEAATSKTSTAVRAEAGAANCVPAVPDSGPGSNTGPTCPLTVVDPEPQVDPDCTTVPDVPPPPLDASTLTTLKLTATGDLSDVEQARRADASLPADVTISDAAVVRAFFNETMALPPLPPNCPFHCLAAPNIHYLLELSGTAGSITFDVDFSCRPGTPFVSVKDMPAQLARGAGSDYVDDLAKLIGVDAGAIPYSVGP